MIRFDFCSFFSDNIYIYIYNKMSGTKRVGRRIKDNDKVEVSKLIVAFFIKKENWL